MSTGRERGGRSGGSGGEGRLREKKRTTIGGRWRVCEGKMGEKEREMRVEEVGEKEAGGKKGRAEEGISHIKMRVLLSVFSLSPCITPWITTTLPLCWRNFQMHPLHTDRQTDKHTRTHIHSSLPLSLHPLLFTELDREG